MLWVVAAAQPQIKNVYVAVRICLGLKFIWTNCLPGPIIRDVTLIYWLNTFLLAPLIPDLWPQIEIALHFILVIIEKSMHIVYLFYLYCIIPTNAALDIISYITVL